MNGPIPGILVLAVVGSATAWVTYRCWRSGYVPRRPAPHPDRLRGIDRDEHPILFWANITFFALCAAASFALIGVVVWLRASGR